MTQYFTIREIAIITFQAFIITGGGYCFILAAFLLAPVIGGA